MLRYYAGIGSRATPEDILSLMKKLAWKLSQDGYFLRSGDAKGADQAFRNNAAYKEIFKSEDAEPWAYEEVKKYLPNDRKGFDYWKPYVKGLLARNMMQVLGRSGDKPIDFVICWTRSTYYEDSSSGGTGYAIRCALARNIPIYNLVIEKDLNRCKQYMAGDIKVLNLAVGGA